MSLEKDENGLFAGDIANYSNENLVLMANDIVYELARRSQQNEIEIANNS